MTTLNDLMDFGHVVYSDGNGNVTDQHTDGPQFAPEGITDYLDNDASSSDDFEPLPDGWELLDGFSGQQGYRGPVMHSSEVIAGHLERHIRSTPGYFVALVVTGIHEDDCTCSAPDYCKYAGDNAVESDDYGWAVAHMPFDPTDPEHVAL
jgi:hypothetical protein